MKKQQTAQGISLSILTGLGTAVLMTALLIGLGAWMMSREFLPWGREGETAAAIILLCTAAGSSAGIRCAGCQRLVVGLSVGCGYFLLLLLCTALAFDAAYKGVWVTAGMIFAGSGLAVLLMPDRKNRRCVRSRRK